MKRLYDKVQKWLGGSAEGYVVRRVAFWHLVYYQGSDLLNVKVGGEDVALKLEHKKCVPFGYESAPIEPELAERIYGHPIQPLNEGEAVILHVDEAARLECWRKGAKDVTWMLPVDIDTIRIVK